MGSSAKLESSSASTIQEIRVAARHSNVPEFTTYRERCTDNDFNEMVEFGTRIPGVGGAYVPHLFCLILILIHCVLILHILFIELSLELLLTQSIGNQSQTSLTHLFVRLLTVQAFRTLTRLATRKLLGPQVPSSTFALNTNQVTQIVRLGHPLSA